MRMNGPKASRNFHPQNVIYQIKKENTDQEKERNVLYTQIISKKNERKNKKQY